MFTFNYDLSGLTVVLARPRFPENIGMIARACANMGAGGITLVNPERWQIDKARPLATPRAYSILENVCVESDLSSALGSFALVVGTTARTGGFRRALLHPSQAAKEMVSVLAEGERVALVMGAEDSGLSNEEIESCQRLVTIPTAYASSLNIAQATLLLLYECFNSLHNLKESQRIQIEAQVEQDKLIDRRVSASDETRLLEKLKETLLYIDFLHVDNPDYFFMPLRRFFGRAGLRRHEYDAFMGICRQIMNKCK